MCFQVSHSYSLSLYVYYQGLNHVKVHAVTISAISKKAAKKTNHTLAEIKQSYDMGIIGMSIEARAEKFPVVTDAKTGAVLKMVTKLTLIENILEVNGEKVEQTIAMQQVFEITSLSDNDNKESEVKKLAPMPCTALSVPHLAAIADHRRTQLHHSRIRHNRHHLLHHNKKACGLNAMSAWVSKQSVPVKLALSSLFGVFIAMVVLMFAKLVSMMVMVRRRGRGGAATHDEYARVESMEEMNLGDKAQLPAYTFAILDVKQADTKQ